MEIQTQSSRFHNGSTVHGERERISAVAHADAGMIFRNKVSREGSEAYTASVQIPV